MHHHKGVQNQKAQEAVLDPAGPANVPFSLAAAAVTSSSSMLPFKQPLQWRISIHARFRGVRLRLRASKMFPGWGGEEARFSVVVRLRSFLLKVRSGSSGSPIVLRRSTTFGSRLLRFVEGALRRRSWPRRFGTDAVAAEENVVLRCPPGSRRFHQLALWPLRKKGVPFPSLESTKSVLGSLAFLSHSASHRNHGGVIVHAAVSFFHLILLSKVALARRPRSPVALAALFITSLGVFSLSYLHFMNQIFEAAWMVCFSLLAFTTLLPLADRCQVTFSLSFFD
ncbi:hypothetical protein Taro_017757 [Colocasia esculenta]|uniref:Uncharacterized protein n=1 Tax=Colocasia esculenta TaxID=4460 RepID=A0A843URY9_COLES|nr:hypothetical protein [Colocasia esculenta]